MNMNQNSLQVLVKKIITRITMLEMKVDSKFDDLNESKLNRLDKELRDSRNNDTDPLYGIDEEDSLE